MLSTWPRTRFTFVFSPLLFFILYCALKLSHSKLNLREKNRDFWPARLEFHSSFTAAQCKGTVCKHTKKADMKSHHSNESILLKSEWERREHKEEKNDDWRHVLCFFMNNEQKLTCKVSLMHSQKKIWLELLDHLVHDLYFDLNKFITAACMVMGKTIIQNCYHNIVLRQSVKNINMICLPNMLKIIQIWCLEN